MVGRGTRAPRNRWLQKNNPPKCSAAPHAACWFAAVTKTFPSAATVAARSISASGPVGSTKSALLSSILTFSKIWAGCPVDETKARTMSSSTVAETSPASAQVRKTPLAWLVATFFGAGYLKPGPGTWGSVAAALLWLGAAAAFHPSPHALLVSLLAAIAVAIAAGVPAATIVERESGVHDPGFVVIDEVIG